MNLLRPVFLWPVMLYLRLWRLLQWLTFRDFRCSFCDCVAQKTRLGKRSVLYTAVQIDRLMCPTTEAWTSRCWNWRDGILFRSKREGICWFATLTFKSENEIVWCYHLNEISLVDFCCPAQLHYPVIFNFFLQFLFLQFFIGLCRVFGSDRVSSPKAVLNRTLKKIYCMFIIFLVAS